MGIPFQAPPNTLCPSLAHGSPPPFPQIWLLGVKRVEWVVGVPSGWDRICFLRGIGISTHPQQNFPLEHCEMRVVSQEWGCGVEGEGQ